MRSRQSTADSTTTPAPASRPSPAPAATCRRRAPTDAGAAASTAIRRRRHCVAQRRDHELRGQPDDQARHAAARRVARLSVAVILDDDHVAKTGRGRLDDSSAQAAHAARSCRRSRRWSPPPSASRPSAAISSTVENVAFDEPVGRRGPGAVQCSSATAPQIWEGAPHRGRGAARRARAAASSCVR